MSGVARFLYPLEPVRLSQQWAHDALLSELAEHNNKVTAQEAVIAQHKAEMATAGEHFDALTAGVGGKHLDLHLDRLSRLARYGSDLSRRLHEALTLLAGLEEERDASRDQAMQSRRRLDALDKHRDKLGAEFLQARLAAQFKAADDQWNSRTSGVKT